MPSRHQDHPGLLQRVDFEAYKENYRQEIQKSVDFIGQDFEFFVKRKAQTLLRLAEGRLGSPSSLKALDVGCGIGLTDQYLVHHFKKLHGVDLSRGVVKKAAALNPKGAYRAYNGKKLPYPTASMDVTFAICVLHHVLPEERGPFLAEMARVTRQGGLVMIFEHNPLNPLTRVAVSRCELDQDAHLVGLGDTARMLEGSRLSVEDQGYLFFTPFQGAPFIGLDRALAWLPFGAQYFVMARKA